VGVESEIFVARGEDIPLAEGGPISTGRLPAEDVKGLDFVKIGTLGSALLTGATSGDEYDALTSDMGNALHNFSDDELVFPIPARLQTALAELSDEQMTQVAPAWAATEEFHLDYKDEGDALEWLSVLRQLAQRAEATGKSLFVWMST
jgi:hypothetical protein